MLKDSETSRYAARRTHRTYTREFKAELVAACQVPGASIAAVAGAHGSNSPTDTVVDGRRQASQMSMTCRSMAKGTRQPAPPSQSIVAVRWLIRVMVPT
jgi:transposase-like protein